MHLVRLSIHAWFLEVFQCCFRITLGVGDSSEGGDGSKGEERDKWTHLCTSHLPVSIYALVQTSYPSIFTLSHSHTHPHTFHSSSSLLICEADICRALACSLSEGIFTSQLRKQRSWISGCHCEGFLRRKRERGKEEGRG